MINKRRPRLGFNGFHKHNAESPATGSDALADLVTGPQSLAERIRDSRVGKTGAAATPLNEQYALSVRLRLFVTVIGMVALGLSGYLTYAAATGSSVAGCGGGAVFDCGHVLNSHWSKIVGLPVALPAILLYVGLIGTIAFSLVAKNVGMRKVTAWALTVSAMAASGAAVWFMFLQSFVLNRICPYCMAAHVCGLILAAIVFWKQPLGSWKTWSCAAMGLVAAGGLAVTQYLTPAGPTFEIQPFPTETESASDADEMFDAPFAAPFESPAIDGDNEKKDEDEGLFQAPGQEEAKAHEKSTAGRFNANGSGQRMIASTNVKVQMSALIAWLRSGTSIVYSSNQETENQDSAENQGSKTQEDSIRIVEFGGGVKLNAAHWPLVGPQDARYMFVEMYDYTCSHCRETHAAIKGAREAMGDDLAIIMLPVPMNSACNPNVSVDHAIHATSCELSKIAVAVWLVDNSKFNEFHEWMFDGALAPTPTAARDKASELVTKAELEAMLAKNVVKLYIDKHSQLYKKVGSGAIPKLLFPKTAIIGKYTSSDALIEMIKRVAK